MFFDDDRIAAVREMILADDEPAAAPALAKILPMQRGDFVELFEHHGGPAGDHPPARPAAARVPAAHARRTWPPSPRPPASTPAKLLRRARELHETNPMLGHRGCRLGVSYPEIYEMQVRAIIEAACEVAAAGKAAPMPGDHASAGRQGRGDGLPARADRPGRQGR